MPEFWALAPEYAQKHFDALIEEKQRRQASAISGVENETRPAERITAITDGVAVIYINAPLGAESITSWFSGRIFQLGYADVREAIRNAESDPAVRAILLSIQSPGGTVAGAKELADYIASIQKPVAAYADGLCASAAFWLASATGRIFAPKTALVGSVGVIMVLEDWSKAYEKTGLKLEYITSGKYKAAGADGKELAPEERAYFEERLAALHGIFRDDVQKSLDISAPESAWAEAQLLHGEQARELGLVSQIVRDCAGAIQILMEENMPITLESLLKEAPDLAASLEEKGRAKALEEMAAKIGDAQAEGVDFAKAAAKVALDAENYGKFEALLAKARELKLSASQLQDMALLFAFCAQAPQSGNAAPAESAPASQLEAIISAHANPVRLDVKPEEKSALVADAERRSGGRA